MGHNSNHNPVAVVRSLVDGGLYAVVLSPPPPSTITTPLLAAPPTTTTTTTTSSTVPPPPTITATMSIPVADKAIMSAVEEVATETAESAAHYASRHHNQKLGHSQDTTALITPVHPHPYLHSPSLLPPTGKNMSDLSLPKGHG